MNSTKGVATVSDSVEDLGVPGQNFLRDALTSCTDPLKAIEEFQVNNKKFISIILKFY